MKIRHIVTLFIYFVVCATQNTLTNITFTQPIQILLELGQNYQQAIPRYFEFHQSASLSNLSHQNLIFNFNQNNSSAFQIINKQQNILIRQSQLYNYGLVDPDQYFSGNKKIYRFSDLKKLIGVLDVVQFNREVIVLFQSGYYSFYSIQAESQQLTLKQTKRLLSNITNITQFDRLSYSPAALNLWGNFVKSQDGQELIFVGEQKFFMFNKSNRSFELLLKHESSLVGISLQKAIMFRNQIICAAGERGLRIYSIDFENMQLVFSRYFKPSIADKSQKDKKLTQLIPIDIAYDYRSEKLLVLDEIEGIFWVQLPDQKGDVVLNCEEKAVLVQNCQSIYVVREANMALALCPHLIVIDLQTRTHSSVPGIDFIPTTITIDSARVYLFSRHYYAVYDLLQKTLHQGVTGYEIDFSLIVNQTIITANKFQISKNNVIPEIDTLCISMDQTLSDQFIGASYFSIQFSAKCSSLLAQQHILKQSSIDASQSKLYAHQNQLSRLTSQLKKSSGKCRIIQPIILRVVNSAQPSHILEIVLFSFLGAILIFLAVFYWNQNRMIQKNYQVLTQQKKNITIESNIQSAQALNPDAKADL